MGIKISVGSFVKNYRQKHGITQEEFAKILDITQNAVSKWENGVTSPTMPQRERICEKLGITEAELFGSGNVEDATPVRQIPVISWVCANRFENIVLEDCIEEYIHTTSKAKRAFSLRVQWDCMEPEFREGDYLLIDPDSIVIHNDFVIVQDLESDEATFKQYKKYGDHVVLHPLNPKYDDIELDHSTRYHIIGKVIEKTKKY